MITFPLIWKSNFQCVQISNQGPLLLKSTRCIYILLLYMDVIFPNVLVYVSKSNQVNRTCDKRLMPLVKKIDRP